MIYETTTRPREVLEARIELWNRNTGEITFPRTKSKYNRWTGKFIPGSPKTMKLTSNTNEMLRHYVGNRKKGHVFINERTEKRLTLRHFEKEIPSCYFDGFEGSWKRHHDLNGGDPDVSAKAAGHSKETKARYYKNVSYEEAQESYSRYHPAFVERW